MVPRCSSALVLGVLLSSWPVWFWSCFHVFFCKVLAFSPSFLSPPLRLSAVTPRPPRPSPAVCDWPLPSSWCKCSERLAPTGPVGSTALARLHRLLCVFGSQNRRRLHQEVRRVRRRLVDCKKDSLPTATKYFSRCHGSLQTGHRGPRSV